MPAWSEAETREWEVALNLGPQAAQVIRGRTLDHYLERLAGVRARTEAELRQRTEEWLVTVEDDANNYWKWFHVCEDEINHRGQIRWIRKRL